MKSYLNFVLLLLVAVIMSSCWVNKQIVTKESQYIGNQYDRMKGMTKNQILQKMGTPDRVMSDGAGGEIMRYENRKVVTNSFASSNTTSSGQSGAVAGYNTYGNAIAYGASQSNTNYGYASNTTTSEQVKYVEAFINRQGVCYNVRANVGAMYSKPEYRCVRVANPLILLTWINPLVGIPTTIWYVCNKNKVKPCK